jgi:glycosyltransferase involved in cell wall biosynthesis
VGYDLSTLLVTYNHAPFVAEAIASILAQRVDTPFEIIVADDGSSDETRDIVAQQCRDAGWEALRFLDSSVNLGIARNYQRAFAACESRYVAVLEGDDYWLSPDKLARQMIVLDAHPDCALCATNIYILHAAGEQTITRSPPDDTISFLGPADIIAANRPGNFSACMYRIETLRSLPSGLFEVLAADWIVNICASRLGPMAFIHEPMSVYRKHVGGFWSGLDPSDQNRLIHQILPVYSELTGRAFHAEFERLRVTLEGYLTRC